jgi:hypothetical protein
MSIRERIASWRAPLDALRVCAHLEAHFAQVRPAGLGKLLSSYARVWPGLSLHKKEVMGGFAWEE